MGFEQNLKPLLLGTKKFGDAFLHSDFISQAKYAMGFRGGKGRARVVPFLTLFLIVVLIFQLISFKSYHDTDDYELQTHMTHYEADPSIKRSDLLKDVFELIKLHKPSAKPLKVYKKDQHAAQKFAIDDSFYFSEKYLSNLLYIPRSAKNELKRKHESFKQTIDSLNLESFGPYDAKSINGQGIVMVGGGKFSWLALLNIHQLRAQENNLPVEVFIPSKEEYDEEYCTEILPRVNAKCVLGFTELPQVITKLKIGGYQYKILAILLSSFQNVLLLDADNFVYNNPEKLLTWSPYTKTGLVLWPDCWSRTTHPAYYDIANIEVDTTTPPTKGPFKDNKDPSQWNFHDLKGALPNPSSEAGMMLVNKKKQVKTLLLALYYNIYGPDFYYPILTQGGAGEGDKDTFIAAAYAMGQPVYQVKQSMTFMGYFDDDGFHSKALGHWDPNNARETDQHLYNDKGDLMFMHLSYPKLYISQLTGEIKTSEGKHRRLYMSGQANKDYDYELRIWEIMCQLICRDYQPMSSSFTPESMNERITVPYPKLALGMKYVQNESVDKYCKEDHLPHLEFLRNSYPDGRGPKAAKPKSD